MGVRNLVAGYRLREGPEQFAIASIAVFAIIANAPALLKSLRYAAQPRGLTYTEGVNAILATRPELWFQPVAQAPHFPTIYPLGYHAIVHGLWRATGLSPFLLMHAIGVLSALAGAWALAMLVHHRRNGWLGPALAGALYALSPAVSGASVLGRVDHLAVALGLLALLCAQRDRFWSAVGLTVAAMYVKHSLVVFPLTIAGYWLLFDDELKALRYAGWVGAIGLFILGTLNIISDGQAWLHLVEYNRQHPWLWSVFAGQVVWFAYTHVAIVSILAYCLITNRVRPFAGLFALAAVAVSLATVGKVGAWVGYFLPLIAAGSWLVGDLVERRQITPWLRTGVVALVIVQLALYGAWAADMSPKYDADAQERAIEDVQAVGGPILAEDGTLYVKTGVGQVHEPLMMRFVYEYESYRGDDLSDEIAEQRFTRIVIGQSAEDWQPGDTSRWSDAELQAIKQHYVRVWHEGFYYVYAPRE